MGEVIDLDVLRPPETLVKIGNKEINVGFVPSGITWEVDEIKNKLISLNQKDLQKGGEAAKKGYNLAMQLCSVYCTVKHPEMTVEWFKANTDAQQVGKMAEVIIEALNKAYEDADKYSKKVKASQ